MVYPNVSVTDSVVVWNYPYGSSFNVFDRSIGSVRTFSDHSRHAPDEAGRCTDSGLETMTEHGIRNPLYFQLEYLRNPGVYVQLYLGVPGVDYLGDIEKAMYSRPLCMKVFDRGFHKIDDIRLDDGRYDPYMGWCVLDDGILLFEDNILNPVYEDGVLKITRIRFILS